MKEASWDPRSTSEELLFRHRGSPAAIGRALASLSFDISPSIGSIWQSNYLEVSTAIAAAPAWTSLSDNNINLLARRRWVTWTSFLLLLSSKLNSTQLDPTQLNTTWRHTKTRRCYVIRLDLANPTGRLLKTSKRSKKSAQSRAFNNNNNSFEIGALTWKRVNQYQNDPI